MTTKVITIGGMHCASYAALNERALKKVKGMKSASVNFATHKATVEYDENVVHEQSIYDAITKSAIGVLKSLK